MMAKKDLIFGGIIGFLIGLLVLPIMLNLKVSISFTYKILVVVACFILIPLGLFLAKTLSRYLPVLWEAAKFICVGVLNTLVDWGILNLLMFLIGVYVGIGFTFSKSVSFTVATVNSYFWNRSWTFKKDGEVGARGAFIKFFLISVLGLVINVGVASLIINYVHLGAGVLPVLKANIGAAIATAASLVWNYLGYKFIVFKR